MKNLGETLLIIFWQGAEGECENSQAKGPGLDDSLESDLAPKKQSPVFVSIKLQSRRESFR